MIVTTLEISVNKKLCTEFKALEQKVKNSRNRFYRVHVKLGS